MKNVSEDKLVELWMSDARVVEIAADLGVKPRDIITAWRRMKSLGVLPGGDRPRSKANSKYHMTGDPSTDGRPTIDDDYDPLLERLFEVHHAPLGKDDYVTGL